MSFMPVFLTREDSRLSQDMLITEFDENFAARFVDTREPGLRATMDLSLHQHERAMILCVCQAAFNRRKPQFCSASSIRVAVAGRNRPHRLCLS